MTTLLKKAFDMASLLPHPEQERICARWIAEMRAEFLMSETCHENRRLLESVNAAYADDMPDTEDQMLLCNMRRCHRRVIMEDGQW